MHQAREVDHDVRALSLDDQLQATRVADVQCEVVSHAWECPGCLDIGDQYALGVRLLLKGLDETGADVPRASCDQITHRPVLWRARWEDAHASPLEARPGAAVQERDGALVPDQVRPGSTPTHTAQPVDDDPASDGRVPPDGHDRPARG